VIDGIPVFLRDPSAAEHDEIEEHAAHHHHGDAHSDLQMDFYNHRVQEEFEITRPHGTPVLYQWYYGQKFARSISGLDRDVAGLVALTVCGGSGLDADFLAGAGARVICSDLSLGAAKRARERAQRYGLALVPIVADATRLPFADASVDLVYVHDGLHHLDDPAAAVNEMSRVAAYAVSITEPAKAIATRIAIRFGWAGEFEEAGNRVIRFDLADLRRILEARGFRVVHASRHAMKHPHQPGRIMALLSVQPLFSLSTFSWGVANAIIGRFGNKLAIVAVRDGGAAHEPQTAL
jgi:SAM-dependent methyltransferase